MDAEYLLRLLQDGGLTVYPLGVASIVSLAILFERLWRYRGIEKSSRALTRETVEALVRRDADTARSLCEKSETPISAIYLEAMATPPRASTRPTALCPSTGTVAPIPMAASS